MKTIRQNGVTLVEALGALAIGSMMAVGFAALIGGALDDSKGQQAALHQAQVVEAARKYIKENYAALVAATPAGTVATVDVNALRVQNLLPASFLARNNFGQTACLLVSQPIAGSGRLEALVATSGGQAIPDRDIPFVAATAGLGGGYIDSQTFTTARGASWSLVTTDYRGIPCAGAGANVLTGTAADGGHLVSGLFYDGPGQLSSDFLYRSAVPGRPELNTMNTPLRMANGSAAIVAEGSACGTDAGLAFNAQRELLECGADNNWARITTWKAPVADYAALAGLTTPPSNGDVRLTLNDHKAFSYDAASNSWLALAVDQNGDLTVPRNIWTGNDVLVANNIWAGGQLDVDGRGWFGGQLDVSGRGWFGGQLDVSGAGWFGGSLSVDEDIWSGNDIRAQRDIRAWRDLYSANNLYVEEHIQAYSVEADWMAAGTQTLWDIYWPGDACHIPLSPPQFDGNGNEIFFNAMGTYVVDIGRRPMTCQSDRTFRYANGTYTP